MPAPAVYKYFFHRADESTSTNFEGELQGIYGVNMTRYLSKPGDMTFSVRGDSLINSPDPETAPADAILGMAIPFSNSIWVYRNDKLVWAGLITSCTWQSEARVFNFTASTHDRYLQSINSNWDITFSTARWPANLIYDIFRRASDNAVSIHNNLWPHTVGFPHSPTEFSLTAATGLSGPTYDLSTTDEKAPEFWELIEYALKVGGEYRLVPQDTSGGPPRTMRLDLGQKDGTEAHLVGKSSTQVTKTIQYPGSIFRYWWPMSCGNQSGAADSFFFRGRTDSGGTLPKRDDYPFEPIGFLRVTRRIDLDTTLQTDLNNIDNTTYFKFIPPVTNPTFELDLTHPDVSVYPGDLDVGDFINYIVMDPLRFGFQAKSGTKRVVGTVLSPPSEDGVEQFGVQLEEE